MADITFAKPTFVDGTSQVSAATFQPVVDALDAVVKRAWISTTATGGEDGNDGQPPAPKPNRSGTKPPGYFQVSQYGNGETPTTPEWTGKIKWISMNAVLVGTTGTVQGVTDANTSLGLQSAGTVNVYFERIS
jgi:hypothetical protein